MAELLNVVTWRPGREGKGWVAPNGWVRAWSVNRRQEPHHADVTHPEGSTRLRIAPDGTVTIEGGMLNPAEAARRTELATTAVERARREWEGFQ